MMKGSGVTNGSNNCGFTGFNCLFVSETFGKMSKAKQKGTLAETAVVQYLKQFFPLVERRTLNGQYDKGDIAGVPCFAVEVKNQRSYKIPEWMQETERERINSGEPNAVLVIKPNKVGVTQVGKWWAVMPLEQIASMIHELEILRAQKSD
jgi:hypothetical protein